MATPRSDVPWWVHRVFEALHDGPLIAAGSDAWLVHFALVDYRVSGTVAGDTAQDYEAHEALVEAFDRWDRVEPDEVDVLRDRLIRERLWPLPSPFEYERVDGDSEHGTRLIRDGKYVDADSVRQGIVARANPSVREAPPDPPPEVQAPPATDAPISWYLG